MSDVYVLDACALIAVLSREEGSDKVVAAYNMAVSGKAKLIIHKLNLLEAYYGDYRVHGKEAADNMISQVKMSPIQVVSEIGDNIFAEAGRLKAIYKISLADSIVLAQTLVSGGMLLTADHHEYDAIEMNENIKFRWIR